MRLLGRATALALLLAAAPSAPAAAAEVVPGEVIVTFTGAADPAERREARAEVGGALLDVAAAEPRTQLLRIDGSVDAAIAELEARGDVRGASPNPVIERYAVPDDPFYVHQWAPARVGLPAVWDRAPTGDPRVVVAIVDDGVDAGHPDLAAGRWRNAREIAGNAVDDDANGFVDDVAGWDFVDDDAGAEPMDWTDPDTGEVATDWHGTHVAGIAGATRDNGIGVAGVTTGPKLLPVRVCAESCAGWALIEAWRYAAAIGARVVNASLGADYTNDPRLLEYHRVYRDAIRAARGTLFVAAAGNDRKDTDAAPQWPCNVPEPNVVCVASTARDDSLSSFSNFGRSVELAAPGSEIVSTVPGGYGQASGTSMATPQVAGAAALLFSHRPTATVAEVRAALLDGAARIPALAGKVETGRLDVAASLELLAGAPRVREAPVLTGTPAVGATMTVSAATWTGSPTSVTRQWRRCTPGGACAAVPGATGRQHVVGADDAGFALEVVETATNGHGAASVASARSGVVPAPAPPAAPEQAPAPAPAPPPAPAPAPPPGGSGTGGTTTTPRTGTGGAPGSAPRPTPPARPRVVLRRRGSELVVRVTGRATAARVRVVARYVLRGRPQTRTTTARTVGGAYAATLRLPRAASRVRVSAS
jgi:subtilisin family serine protease